MQSCPLNSRQIDTLRKLSLHERPTLRLASQTPTVCFCCAWQPRYTGTCVSSGRLTRFRICCLPQPIDARPNGTAHPAPSWRYRSRRAIPVSLADPAAYVNLRIFRCTRVRSKAVTSEGLPHGASTGRTAPVRHVESRARVRNPSVLPGHRGYAGPVHLLFTREGASVPAGRESLPPPGSRHWAAQLAAGCS
jgi:hypothetical protein